MPQKNSYRSNRGRSAIARRAIMAAGTDNGFLPQVSVTDHKGTLIKNAMFFGGPVKGGLAPRATSFFVAPSSTNVAAAGPKPRPNFNFVMKTQVGFGPRGLPGMGRVL